MVEATPACPIQSFASHGIQTVAGLQVAHLNTSNAAEQLIDMINAADGDIDLLVTREWPANVTELATPPAGSRHLHECVLLLMAATPIN